MYYTKRELRILHMLHDALRYDKFMYFMSYICLQLVYINLRYTFPKVRLYTVRLMHTTNLNTENCMRRYYVLTISYP
jgi:hypothetical protein